MEQASPAAVYRPRHPEHTVFYRLFEHQFERYLQVYEERFEPRHGPMRRVVQPAVEAYLACGRLKGGFARIRCPDCRAEHLLAFSCQTRNFCPSCQAKRSALFAEKLVTEILEQVPHRHVVLTIPRVLRGLFERERRLLGLLARSARDALMASYRAILDRPDVQPGLVVSIQTFGSYAANFHPHLHVLLTDGAFTAEGEFHELPYFDARLVEEVFRRRVLHRLHRAERLSERFLRSLLGWVHSGFSVFGEQRVGEDDPAGTERFARYLTRAPIALDRLVPAGAARVRVTTPPDPRTGSTELSLDVLDWIHAITTQIPDRGQHLVRYYAWYSNRSRGARRGPGVARPVGPQEDLQPAARPSRASWARLLLRIFEVDPLICAACGTEMKIVSVITEPAVVDAILGHLARTGGRDPFEGRAPPAA
ncbi:MAG: transposase [Acidimicrobiia bacterium]